MYVFAAAIGTSRKIQSGREMREGNSRRTRKGRPALDSPRRQVVTRDFLSSGSIVGSMLFVPLTRACWSDLHSRNGDPVSQGDRENEEIAQFSRRNKFERKPEFPSEEICIVESEETRKRFSSPTRSDYDTCELQRVDVI